MALGESFAQNPDIAEAFNIYEQRRRRRANRLVAMSRQGTRAVQIENAMLCALRDYLGYQLGQRLFLNTLDSILTP